MRDRLIKLLNNFKYECLMSCKDGFITKKESCDDCVIDQLADHILANGVIVPPCKVGDVVKCDEIYYHIYRMQGYEDYETPIHYRYWAEPITDEGEDDFWFWSDSLGEGTVIVCPKEEAEQALKGGVD